MKYIYNYILICSFLVIPIHKNYCQHQPEWLNNVQVFQARHGFMLNQSPIMAKVNFTGQGWGLYFPNNWSTATLESELNAWHSKGKIYVIMGATQYLHWSGSPPVPDSHLIQDLNGNVVYGRQGERRYTICSAEWQDFIKLENRKAIDLNIDGIHFDGAQSPPILMCDFNSQPTSFDSVTMAHFRSYLKENYSIEQLLQEFDIISIDTFNYASWIKTHGVEDTWNNEPFIGIASEFFKFMIFATQDFFCNISEDARNYAMNEYGKKIIVSCNPNFQPMDIF